MEERKVSETKVDFVNLASFSKDPIYKVTSFARDPAVNLTRKDKSPPIPNSNEKETTIKSGELAIKQAQKTGDTLHEAKDKAQMTATAAMSIVHITLLKEVLDRGPIVPYYYVSICLVTVALFMQIFVGLIAIVIANIRKSTDHFRQSACEDVVANICGFKIKSPSQVKREQRIRVVVRENRGGLDLGHRDIMNECKSALEKKKPKDFDEERGCIPGIPCFTTRIYPDYEYDILDRYDCWCAKAISSQLGAVLPREKLERILSSIESTKSDINMLETEPKTDETEKELSTLTKLLDEQEEEKEKCQEMITEAKILERQGKILFKYSDAIRKKRVLKMVSFWQNQINYMLYMVCIMNAFIAGFGLGSPGTGLSLTGGGGLVNISSGGGLTNLGSAFSAISGGKDLKSIVSGEKYLGSAISGKGDLGSSISKGGAKGGSPISEGGSAISKEGSASSEGSSAISEGSSAISGRSSAISGGSSDFGSDSSSSSSSFSGEYAGDGFSSSWSVNKTSKKIQVTGE